MPLVEIIKGEDFGEALARSTTQPWQDDHGPTTAWLFTSWSSAFVAGRWRCSVKCRAGFYRSQARYPAPPLQRRAEQLGLMHKIAVAAVVRVRTRRHVPAHPAEAVVEKMISGRGSGRLKRRGLLQKYADV